MGKTKIYGLKFADDVVLVSDSAEGLREMLKGLERYSDRNKMVVNKSKTKIMVARRGGRLKKDEKWQYKGEELQVVNSFKYLGFWFSAKGGYSTHLRKMAGAAQRKVNAVWGVVKKAKVNKLSNRLLLMSAIAKTGCLYGAEVWGWKKREEIERIQAKYVKMALGLNRNTPAYIWRMESGLRSIGLDARRIAARYLGKVLGMEENRWPLICLKEEVRNIRNKDPSIWGKEWGPC